MRIVLALVVAFFSVAYLQADEIKSLHQPLGRVKPFTLTDHHGRTIKSGELLGKTWVVNFFFTRCLGGCGRLMDNMAQLQNHFADNDNVTFVSLTVDPEYDSPKVLREYAKKKGINSPQWHLLTGDPKYVHELIEKAFFQALEKKADAEPGFSFVHTFCFLLVDENGVMQGYIQDGSDNKQLAALQKRIEEQLNPDNREPLLSRLNYLPTINASLNATCGVFLLIGFVAIKRRWITFHKTCMLIAFVVSMVFLSCYIYYHFFFMQGSPVSFQGQGVVRYGYFAILISHTLLAAIVAPLAIWTVYLGLRDHRAKHMRFARWTFPIWLYVSVTGVVIYLMLYHVYPPA